MLNCASCSQDDDAVVVNDLLLGEGDGKGEQDQFELSEAAKGLVACMSAGGLMNTSAIVECPPLPPGDSSTRCSVNAERVAAALKALKDKTPMVAPADEKVLASSASGDENEHSAWWVPQERVTEVLSTFPAVCDLTRGSDGAAEQR